MDHAPRARARRERERAAPRRRIRRLAASQLLVASDRRDSGGDIDDAGRARLRPATSRRRAAAVGMTPAAADS